MRCFSLTAAVAAFAAAALMLKRLINTKQCHGANAQQFESIRPVESAVFLFVEFSALALDRIRARRARIERQ